MGDGKGAAGRLSIAVAVCTYNRADLLSLCLDDLCRLHVPEDVDVEAVVVDNNSTDDTSEVVHSRVDLFPFPLRYLCEARQGVSHARNLAVASTQADYLAFLDDECLVPSHWIAEASDILRTHRPAFLGGPYFAHYLEGQKPDWYKPAYGNAYFISKGYEEGYQPQFYASGGNMFAARAVFETVRFDPKSGPAGNRLKLAEETMLQREYKRLNPGHNVYYSNRIALRHIVRKDKMSIRFSWRRAFAEGSEYRKVAKLNRKARAHMFAAGIAGLVQTLVGVVRRDRTRFLHWKQYLHEVGFRRTAFNFGAALGD